jgi:hypothetical protein
MPVPVWLDDLVRRVGGLISFGSEMALLGLPDFSSLSRSFFSSSSSFLLLLMLPLVD